MKEEQEILHHIEEKYAPEINKEEDISNYVWKNMIDKTTSKDKVKDLMEQ